MDARLTVHGARLHNLKNITVSIPKNNLVVFTGISGSGKSTLGFDILHKEGQRQYIESLGLVPFGFAKPPVDSITGLSPSISIDQHLTNRSPRSTVGTVTDVYTYLRVLFARLGHRPCPNCGTDIPPFFDANYNAVGAEVSEGFGAGTAAEHETGSGTGYETESGIYDDAAVSEDTIPCPSCGAPVPELIMAHFSFNKPEGACPACTGLGTVNQVNIERLIDEQKSIADGAVSGWISNQINYYIPILEAAAVHYGFDGDFSLPVKDFSAPQRDLLLYGINGPLFKRHFPDVKPPSTVKRGRFEGVVTSVLRRYGEHLNEHAGDPNYKDKLEDFLETRVCPDCGGTRLRAESRAVTVNGKTIIDLSCLSLSDLQNWLDGLAAELNGDELLIAEPVLFELHGCLTRLVEVGAGYLTPDRSSPTLSAGEAQRLRMASLLGSGLTGVLYVFDEPTIGLHNRDTKRLIDILRRLRDLGNTVLVIEHDLEMIAAADYVVDFGPGAGKNGGLVVAAGSPSEVAAQTGSLTGNYLAGRKSIPIPQSRRCSDSGASLDKSQNDKSLNGKAPSIEFASLKDLDTKNPGGKALSTKIAGTKAITVRGARSHNLQDITVRFPLGTLVAVTGVSGSGKSSLVFDVLDRAIRHRLYGSNDVSGEHDAIEGLEYIDKIITIDQKHIGRVPRSNAATYSDTFTPIREVFAALPEARRLKMSAGHFSFNLPGGRCEHCKGAGTLPVKMQLLPDMEVRCPVCRGRRFTQETLAIRYRGYDISQVLDLTVDEAMVLFNDAPTVCARLQVLSDVGLGYLQLGQPATTLSGGEAQRVKLAKELGRRSVGHTLYLLDEPTTGLHVADTVRLIEVLQRLVDLGNTVIVVEHNLELIKTADWVIDLGPEGGQQGGKLVAQGTPEQVADDLISYTGIGLRELMNK
jgi:excinuclease ABC subunit A